MTFSLTQQPSTAYFRYATLLSEEIEEGSGMAGKYDSPLKRLVEDHPQDFVDWLTQQARFKRILKTDFLSCH
jgi:hypothetical protein